MVNNKFTPKREGGVSRDRACGSGLEGLRSGGEFLDKAEREYTQCAAWVQGREGYGDSDLVGKVGAAVGRDCTRSAVPGVPGRAEGIQLPG